jgi:hypothetical protein
MSAAALLRLSSARHNIRWESKMKMALVLLIVITTMGTLMGRLSATAEENRTAVLVELFTSEGCSSCPPADRLLSELAKTQRVDSARIIPLAFHVDYWDYLGWRDPFASKEFTQRQREYAAALDENSIYTPQMVVDGSDGFVGSDQTRALRAIEQAARQPKARIDIRVEPAGEQADQLSLRILIPDKAPEGDVMLAVTEDALETTVRRGENAGRTLRHDGVVRTLSRVGTIEAARTAFDARVDLRIVDSWKRDQLRVVVFVQDRQSHRIVAAGVADLR